jgi:hypothetical protein
LKGSIEKGIAFANKQQEAAAVWSEASEMEGSPQENKRNYDLEWLLSFAA